MSETDFRPGISPFVRGFGAFGDLIHAELVIIFPDTKSTMIDAISSGSELNCVIRGFGHDKV